MMAQKIPASLERIHLALKAKMIVKASRTTEILPQNLHLTKAQRSQFPQRNGGKFGMQPMKMALN